MNAIFNALQKMRYLRLSILSCMILCLCFSISCSSPEKTYVSRIIDFTTEVSYNQNGFTDARWEQVIDKYKSLREQRDTLNYNFTQKDIASIDSCYRKLNAVIAKSIVNKSIDNANSYMNELKNLIEDVVTGGDSL